MLNIQNEIQDDGTVDYSFLSRELIQLRQQNSLYRKAFSQIGYVANQIAGGDMTARIVHQDDVGDLVPVLSAVNRAFDAVDRTMSEAKILQQAELVKMDELRKAQLTEVAEFFEKQIVPALEIIGKAQH